jgi:Cytochrome C oxidase, cbb3-type, subunit III
MARQRVLDARQQWGGKHVCERLRASAAAAALPECCIRNAQPHSASGQLTAKALRPKPHTAGTAAAASIAVACVLSSAQCASAAEVDALFTGKCAGATHTSPPRCTHIVAWPVGPCLSRCPTASWPPHGRSRWPRMVTSVQAAHEHISCAACHTGGGNVMQAGATLFKSDMQKNGMLDVEAIYNIIYSGKGKMYGFGEGCTPKGKCTFGARLKEGEVLQLAEYTLRKAEDGW